jgi:hypothetical protein
MTTKDRLHELVDELPEGEIAAAAVRMLEQLRDHGSDRLARTLLGAPIDDEPETDEERRLIEEARQELAAGHVVSHADGRRRLAEQQRRHRAVAQ